MNKSRVVGKRGAWMAIALAISIGSAGCGGDPEPKAATPVPQQPVASAPPAAAKSPGPLEILSVLSVEQEVEILAQRDGTVVEVLLDQGSPVKKGATLARMDDRELVAQLDRAKADHGAAESNVKYNEAELHARQAALRRAQEMRKADLSSDADLEEAQFRATGAQHDLDAWRSVVQRHLANIRVLELELEKTRIRAPFDGVVVRRHIQMGQSVVKDDKVFRVGQLTPLLVRFLVPETSSRRPQTGDTVELSVMNDGQRTLQARVKMVSPTIDAASGSYDVTAQLTGNLAGLRPGMAVRVLWPAAAADNR